MRRLPGGRVPVSHRGGSALGYVVVEDAAAGPSRPGARRAAGGAAGAGFRAAGAGGDRQRGGPEQVMGPTREGRKVVISGDTAPCEALAIAAHQADVLVHEATFVQEESERARQTGHSTARQAAELARAAEVRMLALTHLSTRYAGGEVQREARADFRRTEVPRDFDTVEVPFPERGPAQLVRWSNRAAPVPGANGRSGEVERSGEAGRDGEAGPDAERSSTVEGGPREPAGDAESARVAASSIIR